MDFEIKTDEVTTKNNGVKEKKVIKMGLVEFIVFFVLLLMLFLLASSLGIREYYKTEYTQKYSDVIDEEEKSVDYEELLPSFIEELRFETEDENINNIMNLALVNTLSRNNLEIDGTWNKISTGTATNKAIEMPTKHSSKVRTLEPIFQKPIYLEENAGMSQILNDNNLYDDIPLPTNSVINNLIKDSTIQSNIAPEIQSSSAKSKMNIENKSVKSFKSNLGQTKYEQ